MVIVIPFGVAFWICYVFGGFTDLIDGLIARSLNQQSATGAKLDSIADVIFALAITFVVITNLSLPIWIWFCALTIALIRIISYTIGFYKFQTFSSLHSYANKATGMLIFIFPLLYALLGLTIPEIITCIIALLSSLEELMITVKSKVLKRDCKTIFLLN